MRAAAAIFLACASLLGALPASAEETLLSPRVREILEARRQLASGASATAEAAGRGEPDAVLRQARLDILNYNFEGARKQIARYRELVKKAKKSPSPQLAEIERSLENAERALGNVQKIVVIDSVEVPLADLYSSIRIPASAGRLISAGEISRLLGAEVQLTAEPAYISESGELLAWSEASDGPDGSEQHNLREAIRGVDGSYHLNDSADYSALYDEDTDAVAFPFMLSDGTTLYFAKDGEDSMGGLDIFIATRDSGSGEFNMPGNVGMPFNSPANDFLMAVDEENGLGWWLTDRSSTPGYATLYTYLLPEYRVNYDANDLEPDELTDLARLTDLGLTWPEDVDVDSYRALKASIKPGTAARSVDFVFRLPSGARITNYDQLKSADARDAMKRLVRAQADKADLEKELATLRKLFRTSPSQATAARIRHLEDQLELYPEQLKKLRNDVYKRL